ncbi:hypothetical protein DASC09_011470 [Saccharomycopsis crataegensis]|uniref:Uncharacterized protein n=1 Tax=Saccharomycopsis crataegensis TaxID=43959 RepID=A0AAV5QGB7_9ASCO|nr:hypothetical protein DASC09_011470 [Saccharomycopsis crataegensis]
MLYFINSVVFEEEDFPEHPTTAMMISPKYIDNEKKELLSLGKPIAEECHPKTIYRDILLDNEPPEQLCYKVEEPKNLNIVYCKCNKYPIVHARRPYNPYRPRFMDKHNEVFVVLLSVFSIFLVMFICMLVLSLVVETTNDDQRFIIVSSVGFSVSLVGVIVTCLVGYCVRFKSEFD